MRVQVHVEGQISYGRMAEFTAAAREYIAYAAEHGYVTPQVLQGMSGPMNTVRLVYCYDDLSGYERHEARSSADREYGRLASAMPFQEGSISYHIFAESPVSGVMSE